MMVERVARALYEKIQNHPLATPWAMVAAHGTPTAYFDLARAAIEAMREPTEEMVEASDPHGVIRADFGEAWRVMIDEALK